MRFHGPTITRSVSGAPPLPTAAIAAGTLKRRSVGGHRGAGVAGDGRAFDAHRQALAFDAVQERLRERAHDGRRHGRRLARVVQVPPHVIARVHAGGARPLGRLHAVDVVDPVGVLPARGNLRPGGQGVDARHRSPLEPAWTAVWPAQQAEHGLPLARMQTARAREHPLAEFAGDEQLDGARRGADGEAAAGQRQREHAGRRGTLTACWPRSTASLRRASRSVPGGFGVAQPRRGGPERTGAQPVAHLAPGRGGALDRAPRGRASRGAWRRPGA